MIKKHMFTILKALFALLGIACGSIEMLLGWCSMHLSASVAQQDTLQCVLVLAGSIFVAIIGAFTGYSYYQLLEDR